MTQMFYNINSRRNVFKPLTVIIKTQDRSDDVGCKKIIALYTVLRRTLCSLHILHLLYSYIIKWLE